MRKGRCRVCRRENEVVLLLLGVPPFVPGCTRRLALGDELPILCGRLGTKVADHGSPFAVAPDVADVEIVEVAGETWEVGYAGELVGARVGRLAGVAEGVEMDAAVGVEELGGNIETGEGVCVGRRVDLGDAVASGSQGGDGGGNCALNRGCRRNDACDVNIQYIIKGNKIIPSFNIKPTRSFLPLASFR